MALIGCLRLVQVLAGRGPDADQSGTEA